MKISPLATVALCVTSFAIALGGWWIYRISFAPFQDATAEQETRPRLAKEASFPISIVGAPQTPTVLADLSETGEGPKEVACATCHTTRSPQIEQRFADGLDEFHQDLEVRHGSLSCLSCHNADNYDTLKLADGSPIDFENTMQLCAQCHGPQHRDYQNGSHGGMTGYWDLSRGPRSRNACTVCHDAHSPAYPQFMPIFPPKDIELLKELAKASRSQPQH